MGLTTSTSCPINIDDELEKINIEMSKAQSFREEISTTCQHTQIQQVFLKVDRDLRSTFELNLLWSETICNQVIVGLEGTHKCAMDFIHQSKSSLILKGSKKPNSQKQNNALWKTLASIDKECSLREFKFDWGRKLCKLFNSMTSLPKIRFSHCDFDMKEVGKINKSRGFSWGKIIIQSWKFTEKSLKDFIRMLSKISESKNFELVFEEITVTADSPLVQSKLLKLNIPFENLKGGEIFIDHLSCEDQMLKSLEKSLE